MDEEILQDFIIESSEILEQLGEQLVQLESLPDDQDLLNAIFRGFHTIKGGAGFLGLQPMVAISHKAEDVFDLLRSGKRTVNPALMDVVLESLDILNAQFESISNGDSPDDAPESLIASLQSILDNENPQSSPSAPQPAEGDGAHQVSVDNDYGDEGISGLLAEASAELGENTKNERDEDVELISEDEYQRLVETGQQVSESGTESKPSGSDLISEDEFDALLDKLHGEGSFSVENVEKAKTPEAAAEPSGSEPNATPAGAGDLITEDEFDALLDKLHGEGSFSVERVEQSATKVDGSEASVESDEKGAGDQITESEFDALLDKLHGKGKFDANAVATTPQNSAGAGPKEDTKRGTEEADVKPSAAPTKEASNVTPIAAKREEPKPKDPAAAGKDAAKKAPAAEPTVRVDTTTLDQMMNMVGELVLIRNRLSNLADKITNEEVASTVANLDLVTSNLQNVAMQTRMQPIKKVFGRFPRVVRDLSRSLGKDVRLEMVGEDTDLDKNLVEALADPLVHLVRNSVDHGIELPDIREKAGKPRQGKLKLSAAQEGDQILLKIEDDGKGIDADALRKKVVTTAPWMPKVPHGSPTVSALT